MVYHHLSDQVGHFLGLNPSLSLEKSPLLAGEIKMFKGVPINLSIR